MRVGIFSAKNNLQWLLENNSNDQATKKSVFFFNLHQAQSFGWNLR